LGFKCNLYSGCILPNLFAFVFCSIIVYDVDKNNRKEAYELNGVLLGIIKKEKDLGVSVSQDLKVGKQCFKAAS